VTLTIYGDGRVEQETLPDEVRTPTRLSRERIRKVVGDAEPPNAFTDLLWGPSGWHSPDVLYETLRGEQCLTPLGIEEGQHVIELIEKSAAECRHKQGRLMIGGTLAYHVAITDEDWLSQCTGPNVANVSCCTKTVVETLVNAITKAHEGLLDSWR
jgi:hypothetical protein